MFEINLGSFGQKFKLNLFTKISDLPDLKCISMYGKLKGLWNFFTASSSLFSLFFNSLFAQTWLKCRARTLDYKKIGNHIKNFDTHISFSYILFYHELFLSSKRFICDPNPPKAVVIDKIKHDVDIGEIRVWIIMDISLTLRRPLGRKLRMRWFFDVWKIPIWALPDFIFQ